METIAGNRGQKKRQSLTTEGLTPEGLTTIDVDGRPLTLRVRRNPRARQLVLSIDPIDDIAVITLPPHTAVDEGLDLARQKAGWIRACLDALPPRVPFADGARVPLLGRHHRIRHAPGARRPVWAEDGVIVVSGRPEHLARRLRDWLKREARREIEGRVADKAARIERQAGRITLRDTRSRWGSCGAGGNLSFCWRLVMAPETVLDYVVAHEVTHLKYASHGPRFWGTVARLTDDMAGAKDWIRRNGEHLHRYG